MRLLLAGFLFTAPLAAETFVVCAGVEIYDDVEISPLRFAAADARAVAAAFREAGVPDSHITLLTSDSAERLRLPTKYNLLAALDGARVRAREDDTVVVAFSGHGLERGGETWLLTQDTRQRLLESTALAMSEVNRALEGFQGANLLLIIDACRNDPNAGRSSQNTQLDESFAKGLRPQLVARPATQRQPNVALLLACEVGQRAWEYPEERQGAFTYWLLKGLRTEASRTAEGVAVADLAAYLQRQVPAWAQRAKREQVPRFEQLSGSGFLLPAPGRRPQPQPGAPAPNQPGPGVEILRREGVLEITTRLPQVRLEIDGQPAGEVASGRPVRQTRLIGRVTVRGAAAGFVPLEQTVEVKLNQTTTVAVDLPKLPGLTVETELPGVSVEIDGIARGEASPTAPVRVEELTVGEHRVKVSLPGRAPAEQTINLVAGRMISLKLTPLAFPTLIIEVEEEGVTVLLDGQPVGTIGPATPAVVRNVAPGAHQLTARKGGEERTSRLDLTPGQEQTHNAWSAFRAPSYLKNFKPVPGLRYRISPKDGMPQVLIPAGEFTMGTTPEQLQAALRIEGMKAEFVADEQPAKRVYLSAYWMDLHEVTVGQYQRFCQATGRTMKPEYNKVESHPVVEVSWEDAAAYAAWAGRQLPTEAQWEKAARGGTTTIYPWGDTWDEAKANNRDDGTEPVGSYAPNGYGLFDVSGNVWEWCRDWYDEGWYARMPARDPVNESNADARVCRGGSWLYSPRYLRVAVRSGDAPDYRNLFLGFRCAASAP